MTGNAVVVDKVTHEKATAAAAEGIQLSAASVVELPLTRAQIKSMRARGEDLVITTTSGEVIVIKGFFVVHDGVPSDLVLTGEPEGLWKADAPSVSTVFSRIESIEPLLIYTESQALPYVLGGLGVVAGGIGLAALLDDDSSSGSGPVRTPAANLQVDGVTADNVINITEGAGTVRLTGSATGDVSANLLVTITLNGNEYSTQLQADGTWSVDVAAEDLLADPDRTFEVRLTLRDSNGAAVNVDASRTYEIDTAAPDGESTQLVIASVTPDGIVNTTEAAGSVVISGTVSGDFSAGDTVGFTLNGQAYSAAVSANGSWSVEVAGADLVADTGRAIVATLTAHDDAGNSGTVTASRSYLVHATGGPDASTTTLTIDTVTADNVLDAGEAAGSVTVSGSVSGVFNAGDSVSFTLNGFVYGAVVSAAGTWSVSVAGADLAAEGDRSIDAVLTASDAAGNVGMIAASRSYGVSVSSGGVEATLNINSVTPDNTVNAEESAGSVVISGTATGDFDAGAAVAFALNGRSYAATVSETGSWSVSVRGADLAAEADRSIDATLTFNNSANEAVTVSASRTYNVDTRGPDNGTTTVTVGSVTADNVLNAAEATGNVTISGSVQGEFSAGDVISFTLNGRSYDTAVSAIGQWSVSVAGADLVGEADRSIDVTLAARDVLGNTGTVTGSRAYTVDTSAPDNSTTTLTINTVTPDNVVNAAEAAGTVTLSGSVSGDVTPGDGLTFTLGGQVYQTTVSAGGTWSVAVSGAHLVAEADRSIDVTLTARDAAGNVGTVTGSRSYGVDTTPPDSSTVTLTINPVTPDDIVNAAEAGSTVTISGSVSGSGEFTAGDQIVFTLNGQGYSTGVAANGNWSVNVSGAHLAAEADRSVDVTLTAHDAAGNPGTIVASRPYTVDLVAPNGDTTGLSIDPVTGDDIVNATEAAGDVTISGIATGEFAAGDAVTVTVNGVEYGTTVDGGGLWSVDVDGADLAADTDILAALAARDVAGNIGNITATRAYEVATAAPVVNLSFDPVTADNTVNATEAVGQVTISGTVTGDFATGTVTLTINGNDTYVATVAPSGAWSVEVSGSDLEADADATIDAVLNATNAVGNSGSSSYSHEYDVAVAPPAATLTIDVITADNVVNAVEALGPVTVAGTSTGAREGDLVRFTLGGNEYTAAVDAAGDWQVEVLGEDLADAGEGPQQIEATLTATDEFGNSSEVDDSHDYTVDTEGPDPAAFTLTIDPVTLDNLVNGAEAGGAVSITGQVSGGEFNEGDLVGITLNGVTYSTNLLTDGSWLMSVSGRDLAAHADEWLPAPGTPVDGSFTVTLVATDDAGNRAEVTANHPYQVDLAGVALLIIDSITGDNVLNADEAAGTVPITGQVLGEPLGPNPEVTVSVGGVPYGPVPVVGGVWTVDVLGSVLASETSIEASLTAEDGFNNPINVDGMVRDYLVDITPPSNSTTFLTINPVTADNVLTVGEAAVDVTISGTVTGEFTAGDEITLTVNGNAAYVTTVGPNGAWTVDVAGADLLADADLTIDAELVATDAADNEGTVTATRTYTLAPTVPTFGTFVLDLIDDTGDSGSGVDNVTADTSPRVRGNITGLSPQDVAEAQATTPTLTATLFDDLNNNGVLDSGETVFHSGVQVQVTNANSGAARLLVDNSINIELTGPVVTGGGFDYTQPLANGGYNLRAILVNGAGEHSDVGTLDGKPTSDPQAALRINTVDNYNGVGWQVTAAGDFNGDGFEDFLVSAPNTQLGAHAHYDADIYLMYGGASGLPDPTWVYQMGADRGLHLTLSGNQGTGGDAHIQGQSLQGIGDLNGDGYDDFAMATHWNDRVYVVFGRPGNDLSALDLVTLDNNATRGDFGFVIRSGNSAYFGSSVSGGDINGDGYSDLIIGDIDGGANASGSYYVLYGRDGAGDDAVWDNMRALRPGQDGLVYGGNDLGTTNGAVVPNHIQVVHSRGETDMGHTSAVIGDINGDGYNDYIVNAGLFPHDGIDGANAIFQQGAAYLVFGSATGLPNNFNIQTLTPDLGVRLVGTENREVLGGTSRDHGGGDSYFAHHAPISGIGDVNGDGIADFAIGSPYWGRPGSYTFDAPGRVYVVYGRAAGDTWENFNLGTLDGTNGFILRSYSNTTSTSTTSTNGQLGFSIAGGGDINGDGIDDFVIGGPALDNGGINRGSVFVVFGQAGGDFAGAAGQTLVDAIANNGIDLDAMVANGTALRFDGIENYDYMGTGVAVGDWDGDGLADFAYGRWQANESSLPSPDFDGLTTGRPSAGTFHMHSGADFVDPLQPGVQVGDSTPEDFAGTAGVDRIIAGAGNDEITDIGAGDSAFGGLGDDLVALVSTQFARVHGGAGEDTLRFDVNLVLDLIEQGSRVQGFELFDLGGTDSTLRLGLTNVLNQPDSGPLRVLNGGGSAQVDLAEAIGAGGWEIDRPESGYDVWRYDGAPNSELFIEQGLLVV